MLLVLLILVTEMRKKLYRLLLSIRKVANRFQLCINNHLLYCFLCLWFNFVKISLMGFLYIFFVMYSSYHDTCLKS